jgi:ribose transport system permease protein
MKNQLFIKNIFKSRATLLWLILIILILFMCFYTSKDGSMFTSGFMAAGNLNSIFLNLVVQGMMLIGLTCLIIGGEIDLSGSGQATISAMIFAQICAANPDLPWGVALLVCIAFGVGVGTFYAFLVNKLHFMSFIATIGMSSLLSGLASVWTDSNVVPITRESFNSMGIFSVGGRFPLLFIIMLAILIVFGVVMSRTVHGRSIYMLGGNRWAARLLGLKPDRIRWKLFVQNSILAAVSGVFWASQMKQASPTAIISSMPDLTAITAAILGGVAFMGGKGHLAGAFAGMLLLGVFENMLNVLRVPTYWNVFAQGALLIVALILDYMNTTRTEKTLLKEAMANAT